MRGCPRVLCYFSISNRPKWGFNRGCGYCFPAFMFERGENIPRSVKTKRKWWSRVREFLSRSEWNPYSSESVLQTFANRKRFPAFSFRKGKTLAIRKFGSFVRTGITFWPLGSDSTLYKSEWLGGTLVLGKNIHRYFAFRQNYIDFGFKKVRFKRFKR